MLIVVTASQNLRLGKQVLDILILKLQVDEAPLNLDVLLILFDMFFFSDQLTISILIPGQTCPPACNVQGAHVGLTRFWVCLVRLPAPIHHT